MIKVTLPEFLNHCEETWQHAVLVWVVSPSVRFVGVSWATQWKHPSHVATRSFGIILFSCYSLLVHPAPTTRPAHSHLSAPGLVPPSVPCPHVPMCSPPHSDLCSNILLIESAFLTSYEKQSQQPVVGGMVASQKISVHSNAQNPHIWEKGLCGCD